MTLILDHSFEFFSVMFQYLTTGHNRYHFCVWHLQFFIRSNKFIKFLLSLFRHNVFVLLSGGLKEDEIYFTIHDSLDILNDNRVRTYVMHNLLPLMKLYGKNAVIDIDKLLTSFYQLNDQARVEVAEMIDLKLKYSKDEERAKQIKELKR